MQGERAERNGHHREYWSRRAYCFSWGRVGKWITHRRERAAARREEIKALKFEED